MSTLTSKGLIKSSVFLLGIIGFISLASRQLSFSNEDSKLVNFWSRSQKIEAITLGGSHNLAVHFDTLDLTGMHFFDGGGDLDEAKWKLDRLMPLLPNLRKVYIAYPRSVLYLDNRALEGDSQRKQQLKDKLPDSAFIDRLKVWVKALFPVSTVRRSLVRNLGTYAQETFCRQSLREGQYNDGLTEGYFIYLTSPDCLDFLAEKAAMRHKSKISHSIEKSDNVVENNKYRLQSIAQSLQKKSIDLILYRPPYTPQYRALMPSPKEEDEFVAQLMVRFDNVRFVDMSDLFDESLATGVNSYFFDGDHLALPGAKVFSGKLKAVLEDVRVSLRQ